MARPRGCVNWINEKKCAKCGKTFIAAPEHIFKQGTKWYCTWTCYNHRNDKPRKDDE